MTNVTPFPHRNIRPSDIDAGIRRAHQLRSRAFHDSFGRVFERFADRGPLRLPVIIGGGAD